MRLDVGKRHALSIVPEANKKVHDGLVEVALFELDGDKDFVNTMIWLHEDKSLSFYDDVERFVNAKGLVNAISKAIKFVDKVEGNDEAVQKQ